MKRRVETTLESQEGMKREGTAGWKPQKPGEGVMVAGIGTELRRIQTWINTVGSEEVRG